MSEHAEKIPHPGMVHPDFDSLVQRLIQTVDKDKLAELRKDFHTRLRITLTHPDNAELIEDLWDFFYDWCVFEQRLPENMAQLSTPMPDSVVELWNKVKEGSQRGLYSVTKSSDDGLKLKELYSGRTFSVGKFAPNDYLGISRGDIVEGRLVGEDAEGKDFRFVRRPSYHPTEVHSYIKKKVRQFKKTQDFSTYQSWLWLLVGMYLKHRIYHHMPIEKIYDDNSRI